MTKKTDESLRKKAIKMVKAGLSKTQVAKILGLGTTTVARFTKHVGKTFNYYTEDLKQDVLHRISEGQTAAAVSRDLGIATSLICIWQKNAKGVQRIRGDIPDEIKQKAVQLVEGGMMYKAVGQQLKVSGAAVRYWFHRAEAQGKAVKPYLPNKRSDNELLWVQRRYPQLTQWRKLAVEWLKGEYNAMGAKSAALVNFFTRYLHEQGLPTEPNDILRRGTLVPDFFKTACPYSSGGVAYNNRIHDFINWVLLHHFSERSDDGTLVVSQDFRNPVQRLTFSGFPSYYESV